MSDRFRPDDGFEPSDWSDAELDGYVRQTDVPAPARLVDRVMASVAQEPPPRRGWPATLLLLLLGGAASGPARYAAVGTVVALGVAAALIVSDVSRVLRQGNVGTSPPPALSQSSAPSSSPSASPTLSPSPRRTAPASPTPRATPNPTSQGAAPSLTPVSPSPGATIPSPGPSTEQSKSPRPTNTPRPSDSADDRGHG
jgi:hypothetical protein